MTIYIGTIAEKVCSLILRNEDYSTPIEGYDVTHEDGKIKIRRKKKLEEL